MIALDTNVLVRYLVEDDPVQTAKAVRLVERAAATGDTLFVSHVVACEVVWVLTSAYRVARADVVALLRRLLSARELAFDAGDEVRRAVEAFASGPGDFADYLIREHAHRAGYAQVATFDRALLRAPGFIAP